MSYRLERSFSNRSLLANASVDYMQNIFEKDLLIKYQDTHKQIGLNQVKLQEICDVLSGIHAKEGVFSDIKKQLQEEASSIVSKNEHLDRQLIELEKNPCLQNVIERERQKLLQENEQKAEQRRKEAERKAKEKAEQTERELMRRYQESRQKAIQKREQANVQPKQETISEVHKEAPKKESTAETIKSIFLSIPFSILGLFEFYIIYGLTILVAALVFWALSYIPILNTLIDWLFRVREDTPDMFAMMLAAAIAYFGITATAEHIVSKTRKPSLMLTGIYIVVLNIIFLIVNLINSEAILPNIIIGIAGIVMFYKSKNE